MEPIKTGFAELDKRIKGLRGGVLYSLGGRPGMGSTSLCFSILTSIADSGTKTSYFSYDYSPHNLKRKLLSNVLEKEGQYISDELINEYVENKNLILNNCSGANFKELRRLILVDIVNGAKVIFIDTISPINLDFDKTIIGDFSTVETMSVIANELKAIAILHDVAIVQVFHLNRQLETRGGAKIPQIGDISFGGDLPYVSDYIFLLYRAEYYSFTEDENGISTSGIMDIIIGKPEHLDNFKLKFIGENCKVVDLPPPSQKQPLRSSGFTPSDENHNFFLDRKDDNDEGPAPF